MRFSTLSSAILSVVLLFGCGGGAANAPDTTNDQSEPEPAPVAATPAPVITPAPEPAPATAELNTNFGTITLAAGFMPDPNVAEGTSGAGASGRDAATLHAHCRGQVDVTPDHALVLTSMMANMRIIANSSSDTTLVVIKPDGSYACNDDGEGLNPIVVIPNAVTGTYQIFVGSYNAGENATYKLGISELNSVTPSHPSLALPPAP